MTENAPLSTSRYFRISITDRCNLSCYYCHKEGQWNGKGSEGLSASDLVWTVKTALGAGFSKIKLTGGEPTLRPDLPGIVSGMAALEVEDFSMITNGTLLGRLAPALRDAGLPRLNVSLNTLNPRRYAREHGGSATLLENVLRGIDIALDCGFADMKLNFVHNGPRSCGDFRDVTAFAAPRGLPVVLLPMIPYETRSGDETVSLEQLYEMLDEAGIAEERPVTDREGILKRLVVLCNGARVLLRVDELADRHPYRRCADCARKEECREGIYPVRLSADGTLRPCLANGLEGTPLREAIVRRDENAVRKAFDDLRHEENAHG